MKKENFPCAELNIKTSKANNEVRYKSFVRAICLRGTKDMQNYPTKYKKELKKE